MSESFQEAIESMKNVKLEQLKKEMKAAKIRLAVCVFRLIFMVIFIWWGVDFFQEGDPVSALLCFLLLGVYNVECQLHDLTKLLEKNAS